VNTALIHNHVFGILQILWVLYNSNLGSFCILLESTEKQKSET